MSAIQVQTPLAELQQGLQSFPRRYATSADEVWGVFPELRHLFHASIERCRIDGWHQSRVPLLECVPGDVLASDQLLFNLSSSRLPDTEFNCSLIVDSKELCMVAPALTPQSRKLDVSLDRAAVYFCDGFSIYGLTEAQLAPGIFFLTPEELFLRTDIKEQYERRSERSGAGGHKMPLPPMDITGAFVVTETRDPEYESATIGRIMTAAAFADSRLRGSVFQRALYANEGWVATFIAESWRMSFQKRPEYRVAAIDGRAPVFAGVLALLQRSNAVKYRKAKDDYRLLTLDTISDSRKPVALYLQCAQAWMAIERLLSVRSETTIQLAIGLSAFFPVNERPNSFERIKTLYKFRSEVVHGYHFERNDDIYPKFLELASLFQRLFTFAMAFGNATGLFVALRNHVLSGVATSIDVPAPLDPSAGG